MRLICGSCAHVYDGPRMVAGQEDAACSTKPPGSLRAPTVAEEKLLAQLADLSKGYKRQAVMLRESRQQGWHL